MTKEEDERKIYNTRMMEAEKKGLERGMKQGKHQEKIAIAKKSS